MGGLGGPTFLNITTTDQFGKLYGLYPSRIQTGSSSAVAILKNVHRQLFTLLDTSAGATTELAPFAAALPPAP